MKHQESAKSDRPKPKQQFRCPTCRRPFVPPVGAKLGRDGSLPFCSERCKLLDLGAWLDAEYRIPAQPDEASEDALHTDFDDSETTV